MVIIGSSFYRPIDGGVTAGSTGPAGVAGPTGPTGPTGSGAIGPTGGTGAGITSMHISGDNLVTIFQQHDGITFEYVTATSVIGPTGSPRLLIDGTNIGIGATVFYGRMQPDEIKIRSFELADPNATHFNIVEDSSLGTINIYYDIGTPGYLNAHSGNTGELAGFVHVSDATGDPIQLHGFTGTTYDSNIKALNVRIKSFKEKSKFLTLSDTLNDTTKDFYRVVGDVDPWNENARYEGSIDPNKSKIFRLDMGQLTGIPDSGFAPLLVDIQNAKFGYTGNGPQEEDNVMKAFTLIVTGAANPNSYNYRFSNTIWPYNKQPCFSGGTDIFNFFWLPCTPEDTDGNGENDYCPEGHAWYGNIVQWKSEEETDPDPYTCVSGYNPLSPPRNTPVGASGSDLYSQNKMDYPGIEINSFGITGATGACCLGDGDCVHTTDSLCYGYFFGNGTTCGSTFGGITGACFSKLGSCCVHYQDIGNVECFENLSANECIMLRKLLNISTVFGGSGASCLDIDCNLTSEEKGACCDGDGGCYYLTKIECKKKNWVFMGEGVSCTTYNGIDVCSGGTGACCLGITCSHETGFSCLENSGFYGGHGTSCDQLKCNTEQRGRTYNISSLNLEPGDIFAGGMVVGLFQPMNSWSLGSNVFGQNQMSYWGRLMTGGDGGVACTSYRSKYDHHGYGFTSDGPCPMHTTDNIDDAYYIIVSLSPLGMSGDREIVSVIDNPSADFEFNWSNYGSSWGPIYNQNTHQYDDLSESYKNKFKYKEGYWYNQYIGKESLSNIPIKTFNSCQKARIYGGGGIQKALSAPIQTAHGYWKRNWGLYNTIRMVSADNALYLNYGDPGGGYTASQFGPVLGDGISSVRAVRLYDDGFSATAGPVGSTGGNIPEVSSWYLPSHDEMAFIAANCVVKSPYDFNLNEHLLSHEKGVPFDGWYWTSTGAFDETKGYTADSGEGVVSGITAEPNPGSLAWAIDFDINGKRKNFLSGKKGRTTNKYQVRAIRIVRLDGQYSANNKLWKIPKTIRDSDMGINQ